MALRSVLGKTLLFAGLQENDVKQRLECYYGGPTAAHYV
jgi:hypothetical protein